MPLIGGPEIEVCQGSVPIRCSLFFMKMPATSLHQSILIFVGCAVFRIGLTQRLQQYYKSLLISSALSTLQAESSFSSTTMPYVDDLSPRARAKNFSQVSGGTEAGIELTGRGQRHRVQEMIRTLSETRPP